MFFRLIFHADFKFSPQFYVAHIRFSVYIGVHAHAYILKLVSL